MARKKSRETEAPKTSTRTKTAMSRRTAATKKTSTTAPSLAATRYSEEQIRERAYYIFLGRQGVPGDPTSDWYQAEQELNGTAEKLRM